MNTIKYFLIFLLPLLTPWATPWSTLWGCTDIVIATQDGAFINGRSMEFAIPVHSKISLKSRGMKNQSKAPDNNKGLAWVSKYGFLALTCLDQGFTADGMNEQGLSIGVLWFPGAKYPSTSSIHNNRAIVLQDLGNWILGNFATTQEVKKALPRIDIWAESIEPIGIPPIHMTVHDSKGNHLVIEFTEGKVSVSENPNGVLTNFPKLEWQLTNLRNYINMSPINAAPMTLNGTPNGIVLQPTGQGTGLYGIPGDLTSPSRFVRATLFKSFTIPVTTASLGINLMEHLLNIFDIPIGAIRGSADPNSFERTQWIVTKDLKNKILYYRTYEDLTLRYIDLKKLDFSSDANMQSLPMVTTPEPVDMTSKLLQQ